MIADIVQLEVVRQAIAAIVALAITVQRDDIAVAVIVYRLAIMIIPGRDHAVQVVIGERVAKGVTHASVLIAMAHGGYVAIVQPIVAEGLRVARPR